jgi:protein-S-isoprenylcysteine O-methyltransferase Ste14
MRDFFGLFQLIALTVFLTVFIGRSLYMGLVCLDLYAFGAFLLNGTLGFLIFALLLAVGVHYQILQEEGFLLKTYGRAYQRYYDRTARYFGWRSFNGAG